MVERKAFIIGFVLTMLVLLGAPARLGADVRRPSSRLPHLPAAGPISPDEAALWLAFSLFAPERLPSPPPPAETFSCGTAAILSVREAWDTLSPAVQEELKRFPLWPYAPTADRPGLSGAEERFATAHFLIHYTRQGADAVPPADADADGRPDFIESLAESLEYAWASEVEELGWVPPPSDEPYDGDPRFDVYAKALEYYSGYFNGQGLARAGTAPGDNEHTPEIVERNALFGYLVVSTTLPEPVSTALRATAAHEFHHALQAGYDGMERAWLWESVAVWIVPHVYPDIRHHVYFDDWFGAPDICLPDQGPAWGWYGRWIWPQFLEEHRGGPAAVRAVWEASRLFDSRTGIHDFDAIRTSLAWRGYDLESTFDDFALANGILASCPAAPAYCYRDAAQYPPALREGAVHFAGTAVEYLPPDGVQCMGVDYVHITSSSERAWLTFQSESAGAAFGVYLVLETAGRVEATEVPLAGDPQGGAALLELPGGGEAFLVVASHTVPMAGTCVEYDYRITVAPVQGETPSPTPTATATRTPTPVPTATETPPAHAAGGCWLPLFLQSGR